MAFYIRLGEARIIGLNLQKPSLDESKDFAVPDCYFFWAVFEDQNGSRVGTDEPIGLGLSYKELEWH
jgi:hypothetical protein